MYLEDVEHAELFGNVPRVRVLPDIPLSRLVPLYETQQNIPYRFAHPRSAHGLGSELRKRPYGKRQAGLSGVRGDTIRKARRRFVDDNYQEKRHSAGEI